MSIVDSIPDMAHSIEHALRNHQPIGPAIDAFIRVESFPSSLRPAEKFLMALNITIHISEKGPMYERLPHDKVIMCHPFLLTSLDSWFSISCHEFLHWTEWRTGWITTPENGELRAEIGQAILEKLLHLPYDADLGNYWKWHESWMRKLVAEPEIMIEAVTGAVAGVELLIKHAEYEHVVTPERQRINKALTAILDYERKMQIAG